MWDPAQYLHFADERSRPFYDLARRIGATAPGYVVDLGCGPGQLTASLAARWPQAEVLGIDSSTEMIAAAQQADYPEGARRGQLSFAVGDVNDWQPERPPDVIISNAVLQWVPNHLELLPALGRLPSAWRLARVPAAGQLRPADARRAPRAGQLSAVARSAIRRSAQPAGGGSRPVSRPAWSAGPDRRRLGDHLPARAAGPGPGDRVVQGHRPAAGPGRA